jgi:hypothetical protein
MYFCDMMWDSVTVRHGTMAGIGEERRLVGRRDLRRCLSELGVSRIHEVDVREMPLMYAARA